MSDIIIYKRNTLVNLGSQGASFAFSSLYYCVILLLFNGFREAFEMKHMKAQYEAAENGDVDAMAFVGLSYWSGVITKYNTAEALRWLEKGAQNGSAEAMALLGGAYYSGYRTGRDWDKARYWLNTAIESDLEVETAASAWEVLDRIDKGLLPHQWDWSR